MTAAALPPLRILHVIARLNVGGAALYVLELAAEQQRRGHDVLVVAGSVPRGEESMEYRAQELGVRVLPLPTLQRELSLRRDGAAILELVRILRRWRPDVLHTHAAKAGGTARLAALAAQGARPRVRIHTFHGHVLRGYFGPWRERAFRVAERLLAHTTSALVTVSPEVRDDLVAFGVAKPERFVVIPYGFDVSWADPIDAAARARVRSELQVGEDCFIVGWVGRLTAIKRPLDLVRTIRGLVDRGVDAALVAVGDGVDRPDVEELARRLEVAERCHLVGYQKDIHSWFAAFDVFCLTSANEGTPVAVIEALAAQRPVVATRVGGTPAVVADGESGFLVEPGDTATMAARLEELARDAELRERMGRRGAELMRERYAKDRMVEDVEQLYAGLLAR